MTSLLAERSLKQIAVAACVLSLVAFAALFALAAMRVFLLIFVGVVVAVFFQRSGVWLASRVHAPDGAGLPLVLLGLVAFFALSVWFLEPRVAAQFTQLQSTIPQVLAYASASTS